MGGRREVVVESKKVTLRVKINKQWINSWSNCNGDKKRKSNRLNGAAVKLMNFSRHYVLGKELEMRGKYATG